MSSDYKFRDSGLKFINCGVRLQIHISIQFTNELEIWLLHSLFNMLFSRTTVNCI